MRVVELTAVHVRIPLRKPIRHASHTRIDTDNLLIRCMLEDGTQGFGEGVPRQYVTGETIDSALDLLRRSDLPGQLGSCRDMTEAVRLAERIQLPTIPGDDRACQGHAAPWSVELAIPGPFGRPLRQPFTPLAPVPAPDLYKPRAHVRYSGAITSTEGVKLRWTVWKYRIYR